MCKASTHLSEMEKLISRINCDFDKLNKALSKYDKLISEHYHKIESANFNACEGFYLSKNLQELLRKRRIVKDEYLRLSSVQQSLNCKDLHKTVTKQKTNMVNARKKSKEWQQKWNYTYSVEELLS